MDRPLIIYLHGFCSSPASWKSRLLGEFMAEQGLAGQFACPPLSPVPDEAVASVSRSIERADGPVTLVGSSLGGHYAYVLAKKHGLTAVLINPVAVDRLDLHKFVGAHANFHTGERFVFSEAHAAQLRAQVTPRPADGVKPAAPSRCWLLLETGDEVLDYRQARAVYADCRQTVLDGGNHGFTRFPEFMAQILEFAQIRTGL